MGLSKVSFEDSLEKNVVNAGKCVGCGACVLACPFSCLEYRSGKPVIVKECRVCGVCAYVCPQKSLPKKMVEKFVFHRERLAEEKFGVYYRIVAARAKDDEIRRRAQNGGAVSALLVFGLEEGFFDGIILSGLSGSRPLYPEPKLATTAREVLECAGTRYTYSPNILALSKAVEQGKSDIAFVGTPCQVEAIRRMQLAKLSRITASLKMLVGLMCSECFTYEGLMEGYIRDTLGIGLKDILKVDIKGEMHVTTSSGKTVIPVRMIKPYVLRGCRFCSDFTSEPADLSAGRLGLEGWTIIVIRTRIGEEIVEKAVREKFLEVRPVGKDHSVIKLLSKLSYIKRSRATILTKN